MSSESSWRTLWNLSCHVRKTNKGMRFKSKIGYTRFSSRLRERWIFSPDIAQIYYVFEDSARWCLSVASIPDSNGKTSLKGETVCLRSGACYSTGLSLWLRSIQAQRVCREHDASLILHHTYEVKIFRYSTVGTWIFAGMKIIDFYPTENASESSNTQFSHGNFRCHLIFDK